MRTATTVKIMAIGNTKSDMMILFSSNNATTNHTIIAETVLICNINSSFKGAITF